ncbi:putative glycosyltransferase [Rhodococcus sp. RD6.2]|uniref:glycosyltransferase family 2 protein n=1 Tax=Rhodococcus sp. RD6.2 TaxID=260936 RepID=UPI00063BC5B5|nr:glycosyltransferase family A protein [Rhodococcus sp. RD6.2]CRK49509.1 putative glycosyltransferase [Rhodococcus sp. RD6.2]
MSRSDARPLISFLTTAWRTERYVGESIGSVLDQTRGDWELIVVDNGRSDEIARIVEDAARDPRITLVRQDNAGYGGGVSTAALHARGRYFCVLDSDDLVAPEFCARIGAIVDGDPGVDAVGCDAELFPDPDDGQRALGYFDSIGRRRRPDPARRVTLDEMFREGVPFYCGAIRREAWAAHRGYRPGMIGVEPDVVLWLRLVAGGGNVRLLPDRLARCRVRGDSLSHDPSTVAAFEQRLQHSFVAVAEEAGRVDLAQVWAGMLRRLRYTQALGRARSALLGADVTTARAEASVAVRCHPTVRAIAVFVGVWLCPAGLRRMHPVKARVSAWVGRTMRRYEKRWKRTRFVRIRGVRGSAGGARRR